MKRTIISIMFILIIFSAFVSADTSDAISLSINLVNQDPDPALAGEVVEIRLGIENKGGEAAQNLVLEIQESYPFSMAAGESASQNIGTISAFQYDEDMKIVKFKIRADRDATAGSYELKVRSYEEGSPSSIIKTLSLDVESKDSAEVIYIDQVELIPGKITPLKFTINNVGSTPLRELSFQWENEDDIILPVGSDNTKYLRYIEIGDSAELEFDVIASANADPDLYKLDLILTYQDPITGESKDIESKAGIYVGGATDFDVAFSGSSNGESSFSVSNIGSVSASSVTVKIPDQEGWKVQGSNSVIIGNLNEGDYTIASFKVQQININKIMPGQEDVPLGKSRMPIEDPIVKVDVVYTDSRGNRDTITKNVSIDISDMASVSTGEMTGVRKFQKESLSQQIWNNVKWPVLLISLLVIVILFHKRYKKGKLNDSGYTYWKTIRDLAGKKKR